MNDLIRPTLYQAWMDIVPVKPHHDRRAAGLRHRRPGL